MTNSPQQAQYSNPDSAVADIKNSQWVSLLPSNQQDLVLLAVHLYIRERELNSNLDDYSYIIFPMAKAYEGFLKLYFYELHLIDKRTYEGRRFRIGRALNPDIRKSQRDEYWLYDDIAQQCGHELARMLWDTWIECRNQVFHYFPNKNKTILFQDVAKYLLMISESITKAYNCKNEDGGLPTDFSL